MNNPILDSHMEQRTSLLKVATIAAFASMFMVLVPFSLELLVMRFVSALIFMALYFAREKLPNSVIFTLFVLLFLVNGAASGMSSSSEFRSLFMFVVMSVMMAFMVNRKIAVLILSGVFIAQAVVAYDIFDANISLMLTSAFKASFICGLAFFPVKLLQDQLAQKIEEADKWSRKISVLEDEKVLQLQRANKLNENFKEFIYAISHDLRAPIRAISGFVRMLSTDSDKKLSPQEHLYMERIETAAIRLNGMVERLTQLSRLQTNMRDVTTIDMSKLLNEMADVYRKKYASSIEFHIDNNMTMAGDIDEITMLFNELLDNACKNLQPRQLGVIHVGCKTHAQDTVFFVQDNGIGVFNENDLATMTKLFRTIHAGEKSDGVGLSLASFVVEKMGGVLEISSPGENQGTTVAIKLPKSR
ncbi:MAG TPA: HAMP domain-containing sensor histidine kinase [Pseudomonadales bacterium]|nr:HAMP domain-containing sensor histidine kinase [Pseudomonadales bacterium]